MTIPHLQLATPWIEGHQVDGVTVTHPRVIETAPIVVDGHRTVGDLVAAVAVDIGHTEIVVALSGVAGPLGIVGIECPTGFELMTVPVPGDEHRTGIVAATEDR